jgi:hypothetical protein
MESPGEIFMVRHPEAHKVGSLGEISITHTTRGSETGGREKIYMKTHLKTASSGSSGAEIQLDLLTH